MSDFIRNQSWFLERVANLIPREIQALIEATPLSKLDAQKDRWTWTLTSHGEFNIRSLYHSLQNPILELPMECSLEYLYILLKQNASVEHGSWYLTYQ